MSTTAAPRTTATPGLAAWRNALIAVFTVMGFSVATQLSRLPTIRGLLQIDNGQVGLFIAIFSVGALAGLAVSAPLLHRLGPQRIVLIAMPIGGLLLAATGLAGGLARSYVLVLVVIVVFGATVSVSDVSLNVSGAANERALGRAVMPYFHAGYSIGYVLGAAVSSGAEAIGVPIWLHFTVVGAICLATPFIAGRWMPNAREADEVRPDRATRRRIWREPRTWAIGVLVFGFAYAEGAATDWLPLGVVDGRGFDNASAAALLGAFMVAMTVGRLAGSWFVDRFGRFRVLIVEAALAFVGLALVIYVPEPWVVWAATILWGLGVALGFPLGMSAAGDDPATAATRVSAVSLIGYTAYLVGPSLVGFVAQWTGVLLALNLILGLIVIAAVLTPATRERGGARPSGTVIDPGVAVGEDAGPRPRA